MSDLQQVPRSGPSIESLPIAPETDQINELPTTPRIGQGNRGRACSHVSMGYFDREGVEELRRTLTHISAPPETVNPLSSETLSVPATGPFDFEKMLQTIVKKCVIVVVNLTAPDHLIFIFFFFFFFGKQARPRGYSVARAWCPIPRSPRRRPRSRCQLSDNIWLDV